MIVGVLAERHPGERRVSLIPASIPPLGQSGLEVYLEPGAGDQAGFPDSAYLDKGSKVATSRPEVISKADILAMIHLPVEEIATLRRGQILVGMLNPLGSPEHLQKLEDQGVTAFALELLPRITRAQSMDVLSSMATIAGYKAVLLAAEKLDKMFPLLMTAAGTITPAKVFVLGGGVAGLQAIATAHRLGAVVLAYDVRPAVKEQVESLGGKFLEIDLPMEQVEGTGGYAKAMNEEFYDRQREAMTRAVAESDVVITTAAVPGKAAPKLITEKMIQKMRPGAVVVDLAAESGGNCELTCPGESIQRGGVNILGPMNLPSSVPRDASQMYSRNLTAFLQHLIRKGQMHLDPEDDITKETMVIHEGRGIHPPNREMLGQENSPSS